VERVGDGPRAVVTRVLPAAVPAAVAVGLVDDPVGGTDDALHAGRCAARDERVATVGTEHRPVTRGEALRRRRGRTLAHLACDAPRLKARHAPVDPQVAPALVALDRPEGRGPEGSVLTVLSRASLASPWRSRRVTRLARRVPKGGA
jgi:hypothetical protein